MNQNLKNIKWKPLLISLGISFGAALISKIFTAGSMEVYAALPKPPLAPPGWLFPVVWTVLYFLMGVASYLIYVSGSVFTAPALRTYGAQLIANILWSVIFFGLSAYILAFAWLVLLWYLVFCTIKLFFSIDSLAGKLMIPYIIWITYAGYLNLYIAVSLL